MSRSPPEAKLASVLSSVDLYFYLVLSCSERDTDPLSKTFLEHNLKKKKLISFYLFLTMLRQPKLKERNKNSNKNM